MQRSQEKSGEWSLHLHAAPSSMIKSHELALLGENVKETLRESAQFSNLGDGWGSHPSPSMESGSHSPSPCLFLNHHKRSLLFLDTKSIKQVAINGYILLHYPSNQEHTGKYSMSFVYLQYTDKRFSIFFFSLRALHSLSSNHGLLSLYMRVCKMKGWGQMKS